MYRFVLLCCICLFSVSGVSAQAALPPVKNTTFKQGEYLKFKIHYGFINAGFATLQVDDTVAYMHGRPCYHIVGKGFTNSSFDLVYKVRDNYESWVDQQSLVSWRFNRHIVEGGFNSYTETWFDHAHNQAHYIDEQRKKTFFEVPDHIQDVISAFYFARANYDHRTLKPGDIIDMTNFIDRKTVPLKAELLKREEIKVGDKKYKALKFKLMVEESGLVTDGSKIDFWITDDFNKIPLRIELNLMIGALRADLVEYKYLRNPFSSLVP